MMFSDQQAADFERAKQLYTDAAAPWFREVRADLQSIFAWQDAYIEAVKRQEAKAEELDRFIRQAQFVDEQVTAQGGVGAISHIFKKGDDVELSEFEQWIPGKVVDVKQEGPYTVYAVKTERGDTYFQLLPERLRPRSAQGKCIAPTPIFEPGQYVEIFKFDVWIPAQVIAVGDNLGTPIYVVEHDAAERSDGLGIAAAIETEVHGSLLREPDKDVGWFPGFGPTKESRETFYEAVKRFTALEKWDVEKKLPHRKPTIEAVRKYRDEWLKEKAELAHFGGFKNDVDSLAKEAAEKGFVIEGGPLPAVDVESVSAANKTAAAVAQAQKEVTAAARELAADTSNTLASSIGSLFDAIPTGYKLAGGVIAVGLLGVYAANAGRRPR